MLFTSDKNIKCLGNNRASWSRSPKIKFLIIWRPFLPSSRSSDSIFITHGCFVKILSRISQESCSCLNKKKLKLNGEFLFYRCCNKMNVKIVQNMLYWNQCARKIVPTYEKKLRGQHHGVERPP